MVLAFVDDFLAVGSVAEVNISDQLRRATIAKIQQDLPDPTSCERGKYLVLVSQTIKPVLVVLVNLMRPAFERWNASKEGQKELVSFDWDPDPEARCYSSFDYKGSVVDHNAGSVIDHKGSVMDHNGSVIDGPDF